MLSPTMDPGLIRVEDTIGIISQKTINRINRKAPNFAITNLTYKIAGKATTAVHFRGRSTLHCKMLSMCIQCLSHGISPPAEAATAYEQ
jgi:hypothetical protein